METTALYIGYAILGSKCLPDESEPPILSKVEKIGKNCKDEPKFKVGDYVRYKADVRRIAAVTKDGKYFLFNISGSIPESDLEPYAEPLSQNPTENCDNENPISNPHTEMQTGEKYPDRNLCDKLIQRGFKNHNRLHLAAMAMQAIISRGKGYDAQETAVTALEFADALIAEAEKGGKQ